MDIFVVEKLLDSAHMLSIGAVFQITYIKTSIIFFALILLFHAVSYVLCLIHYTYYWPKTFKICLCFTHLVLLLMPPWLKVNVLVCAQKKIFSLKTSFPKFVIFEQHSSFQEGETESQSRRTEENKATGKFHAAWSANFLKANFSSKASLRNCKL